MLEYGYGVLLANCCFKQEASQMLLDHVLNMGNDELYHQYAVFCDNYGLQWDDGDAKENFVEIYEDDYTGCGFAGLLARTINDAEYEGEDFFVSQDNCLYVKATIPVDDDEKDAMPTQKDIQRVLKKYLNPLLETPADIVWLDIAK